MLTLPGSRLSSLATMIERVRTGATTSRSKSPLRNRARTAWFSPVMSTPSNTKVSNSPGKTPGPTRTGISGRSRNDAP